jgi:hypothetical protein
MTALSELSAAGLASERNRHVNQSDKLCWMVVLETLVRLSE